MALFFGRRHRAPDLSGLGLGAELRHATGNALAYLVAQECGHFAFAVLECSSTHFAPDQGSAAVRQQPLQIAFITSIDARDFSSQAPVLLILL